MADVLPQNFLGAQAGIFMGAEALPNDVFYAELVLGRYLIRRFFAIEGNVGYFTSKTIGHTVLSQRRGGFPIRFLNRTGVSASVGSTPKASTPDAECGRGRFRG